MLKKIYSLAAVAALALAGSALADDQSRGAPGIDAGADASVKMPTVDKNSDGKVTRSEAASNQQLSQQFDSLDANKDGALNQAEFAKFEASGEAEGKAGKKDEPATTTDRPGTTDDTTPSSEDQGPSR